MQFSDLFDPGHSGFRLGVGDKLHCVLSMDDLLLTNDENKVLFIHPNNLSYCIQQGSALSPLLSPVCTRPLGELRRRPGLHLPCLQYSEDTQIYVSITADAFAAVERMTQSLQEIRIWMRI